MKQILVGIFDTDAGQILGVRPVETEKVAIRDLDRVVNPTNPNEESNISRWPDHFNLMCLGIIETTSGLITTQVKDENGQLVPVLHTIINLGSLVNTTKSAVKADDLPIK